MPEMMPDTKDELVKLILNCLPNPEWVVEVDPLSYSKAVLFSWRGDRFRVSLGLNVETVARGFLGINGESILLQELLKQAWFGVLGETMADMEHDDDKPSPPMPSDKDMLDWLQEQNNKQQYTGRCLFRYSTTGRGWRLHETDQEGSFETVRAAIASAMFFNN